jgi:uncharacterized protein YlaN (UPF0358 family)
MGKQVMAKDIVTVDSLRSALEIKNGEYRIDHRIVAEGLGQKSAKSWRENILQTYETKIARLGGILKMPLEDGTVVWYLNEAQANFAGTLSRNTEQAVEFKLRLIEAFEQAKKLLIATKINKQNQEWIEARASGKLTRRVETDTIKEFVDYAIAQGSASAEKYYLNISKMQNKALFFIEQKYPNLREVLDTHQLGIIRVADHAVAKALRDGMRDGLHYKDIYKLAKANVEKLAEVVEKTAVPSNALAVV